MNKKGFTLIELTTTLALLGIISAISIPSYFSWLPRHKLQTSVRYIYDDMNMARSRAVKNNTVAVAIFNISNDTYTVFLDTSSPVNWALDAGETVLSNGTLENGVDILSSTFTSDTYGFNSRGMTRTPAVPGEVRLTNPSGLFMGVRVTTSGCLKIINSTDGGTTWS
jgi:type IV fimbrial biogenesis protein FimT